MAIVSINGVTVPQIEEQDLWGEIWGPNEPDVSFAMEFASPTGVVATTLTKGWIELQTVPQAFTVDAGGRAVGYLHFTSFLGPSEGELRDAFLQLQQAGVTELVVDLRYNGGGLVSIAQYLIDLLAGATASVPASAGAASSCAQAGPAPRQRNRGITAIILRIRGLRCPPRGSLGRRPIEALPRVLTLVKSRSFRRFCA